MTRPPYASMQLNDIRQPVATWADLTNQTMEAVWKRESVTPPLGRSLTLGARFQANAGIVAPPCAACQPDCRVPSSHSLPARAPHVLVSCRALGRAHEAA